MLDNAQDKSVAGKFSAISKFIVNPKLENVRIQNGSLTTLQSNTGNSHTHAVRVL